jgi:hypothetical protein
MLKLLCLALLISFSLSCSCIMRSDADAFAASDLVFEGKVKKVNLKSEFKQTIKFDVLQTFKGEVTDPMKVNTNGNSAMCGFHFEDDASYVVFAYKTENGKYETNLCSKTQLSNPEIIKLLKGLTKP